MDILVVNCDDTFHLRLTEEDFFQTLISDKKVMIFIILACYVILLLYIGSKRPAFQDHCTNAPVRLARELLGKGI